MAGSVLGPRVMNSIPEQQGVANHKWHLAFCHLSESPSSPRWWGHTQLTWGSGHSVCSKLSLYSFPRVPNFVKLIENTPKKIFFIRKYFAHTPKDSTNTFNYSFMPTVT